MHSEDQALDYSVANNNVTEFRELSVRKIPQWVDERYLNHRPFAFSAYNYPKMKRQICLELDAEYHNVWCTGSGALGFSLNPNKLIDNSPKLFDRSSDLDIAIVSTHIFDQAWRELRETKHNHDFELDEVGQGINNIGFHKKRVFDGAIMANRLFGSIESGRKWQKAVSKLSAAASEMFGRNVEASFWIYRDVWSVRNYVANSAKRMKGNL